MFKNEFFKMISLMKKKKWSYIFVLILSCAVNSLSNILSAFVNKDMIKAAETGNFYFMVNGAILAVAAFAIGFLIFPSCIYLKVKIIKKVIADIKLQVFKHIEYLPLSFYEKSHSGEIISTLTNDISVVENALNDDFQMVGVSVIGGISSAIIMFTLDYRLSIITILLGIISARVNISFTSFMRSVSDKIQSSKGALNKHLVNIIAGFRTAKIFNLGRIVTGGYIDESKLLANLNIKRAKKFSLINSINYLLGLLCMTGIYILGALMVIKGMTDLSTVVAIVGLQKGVNFMFLNFGRFFTKLQCALAGSNRLYEILDNKKEQEGEVKRQCAGSESCITLNNVDFSYDGKNNLLNNFNMKVPKGKVIYIVGESGCGKSTIAKLLMGFFPIKSGDILINGKSISEYSLSSLRDKISYVPQEPHLFSGTIEENIMYGREGSTREEVIEAAKKANAHDFIMKMPKGYDEEIGEGGFKLSGGQKQCISLARAFIKNAPIFILDEAASAMDGKSLQLVQKGLDSVFEEKTAIVISHRLYNAMNADFIYVIKNGMIYEHGTHSELIKKGGLYKKLFNNNLNLGAIKCY